MECASPMLRMTKLPLVVVRWIDAWGDMTTAVDMAEALRAHKPEVVTTLGYVLVDDAEGIQLAGEICDDGTYRARSFIPRGMVKSVTPYKLTKPRAVKPKPTTQETPHV